MTKSMILKELRESAGLVVLGLIGLVFHLANLTGFPLMGGSQQELWHYPFVQDSLSSSLWMIGGGLAIAIGLKQTAWEEWRGTFYFLLHRPVSRRRLFGIKMAVGCLLTMAVSSLLVLLYAWWAMTPGKFPAPFFWSMTFPAWRMCFALPPVYFGAFLSGLRPARWFGSRLAPLLASFLAAGVASAMPFLWLTALIALAASAALIVVIFHYAAHRDF